MPEYKRIDDLAELIQVAVRALRKALADGDEKHPPGSWMGETYANQINHLQKHLGALLNSREDGEDHLAHIICRAVIAKALLER